MFYKHYQSQLEVRINFYNSLSTWQLLVKHKSFICESLNTFSLHCLICFHPRFWNDDNCEENAGEAGAGDADEDGGEAKLGAEQKEQFGDSKAKKPKRAVVKTSYHLLGGKKHQSC